MTISEAITNIAYAVSYLRGYGCNDEKVYESLQMAIDALGFKQMMEDDKK